MKVLPMKNPKKLPKKCEWRGCKKRATTSVVFGGQFAIAIRLLSRSELCNEHAKRRAQAHQKLLERKEAARQANWWWCAVCGRAFETLHPSTWGPIFPRPCPFCNVSESAVRSYSKLREIFTYLPLVPEEGGVYPVCKPRVQRFSRSVLYRYLSPDELARFLGQSSETERCYIHAIVDLKTEKGIVKTRLRTAGIKTALAEARIIKCYEAKVSVVDVEHQQLWRKLQNRILRLYGRRCMRCGRTDGQLYLDHIQNWQEYPERRYDPENIQLLCRECHTWKHRQVREWDFRPAL